MSRLQWLHYTKARQPAVTMPEEINKEKIQTMFFSKISFKLALPFCRP